MRKNNNNNFYCKFIYIYSPITKCNCRPHTHNTSTGSIHNFYDGKWSIYLDFPCKFIVLFSLIFLPFAVTADVLVLLLSLLQFNSIFVGAIFVYLYLLFGLFIDRKSLISTYAYHTLHTLHANVRTLWNDVLRVLRAYYEMDETYVHIVHVLRGCVYVYLLFSDCAFNNPSL